MEYIVLTGFLNVGNVEAVVKFLQASKAYTFDLCDLNFFALYIELSLGISTQILRNISLRMCHHNHVVRYIYSKLVDHVFNKTTVFICRSPVEIQHSS